jgi:hypothetical protein
MMRRASILLAVLVAGCAGGDLSRADTDAALGADDGGNSTTSGPVTTGLTGISGGASTHEPAASTSGQPSPSGDETGEATTGADASSGDIAESSGGESSGGDETGPEPTSSTSGSPGEDIDLSGWTLHQANSARQFTLPEGTVVAPGTVIVLGRDASRGAFEQHWGALDADVVYLDTEDAFPAINGGETFTLRDAGNSAIDGPTPALQGSDAVQRLDLSAPGMWGSETEGNATPGIGHPDPGHTGAFITEASDASGSGAFVYEYVELQVW